MTMSIQSIETPTELPTHGVFEIQDLHPGMGTIIGTAMRRVLLSSVPGPAAAWMRIGGIPHEFATIPGVKEDVQELILRMRGLRFRVYDRAVHSLSLHVRGRDAMAGDLTGDGRVEILNPLYKIATLGEKAELRIELLVWCDRDKSANRASSTLPQEESLPLDMLWLDPIYSPIERVSVEVDEQPEADHLRLQVWTTGSVSPREAVDWAGRILSEMTGSLSQALAKPEAASLAIREAEGRPLETLGLSNRSYNRLKRAHFDTVEEILSRSRRELSDTHDLGPKTLLELEEKLAGLGLHFRVNAG